jgi:tRNA (guanine37-N1)-methyltransferase
MKVGFLTIFPQIVDFFIYNLSIIKRSRKFVDFYVVNIRDFATDKHKTVDDYVFGSGRGMLLRFDVVFKALQNILKNFSNPYIILPSPRGRVLDNLMIRDLSKLDELIFLCPNYEGVDDRILRFVREEISIGNYCISSGELASFLILDSILRFKFDLLVDRDNLNNDSFNYMGFSCLLEPFQFTRPKTVSLKPYLLASELSVDHIFISGNHKNIQRELLKNSIEQTIYKKPDLFKCFLNEFSTKIKENKNLNKHAKKYYYDILLDAIFDSVMPS